MLNFSVIPTVLEIKIAEKMSYIDIKEFELASKHSKKIVRYVKHQPVVEVEYICAYMNKICFYFGRPRAFLWSTLSQYVHLPRFSLRTLAIYCDLFQTIRNKVTFVNNKVHLIWNKTESDMNHALDVISEMVTIGKFTTRWAVDPDVLNHVALRELDAVNIWVEDMPDKTLLQLKSKYVAFREFTDLFRVNSVENLAFKQWFREEREIQWFFMHTARKTRQSVSTRREILFRGLFYSTVFQNEEEIPRSLKFLKGLEHCAELQPTHISKGDGIYSIDRGDKKLLVFQSNTRVIALEYTNLEDVVKFEEFG